MGTEFLEHWERFDAVEGKAVGSVLETGVLVEDTNWEYSNRKEKYSLMKARGYTANVPA